MERQFIEIGYHKGEIDFGVNGSVRELSLEEMDRLRVMMCVAIQQAQNMWLRHREQLPENQAKQSTPTTKK